MSNIDNPQDRMNFIAQSIANAKRVMQKVDSGSFSRGHINKEELYTTPVEHIPEGRAPQQQNMVTERAFDDTDYNEAPKELKW